MVLCGVLMKWCVNVVVVLGKVLGVWMLWMMFSVLVFLMLMWCVVNVSFFVIGSLIVCGSR